MANSKDVHELLQESHDSLRTTDNVINEPSTINKINCMSQFMSNYKKITNLLNNSAINLALLKNYIQFKGQVQEKELKSLCKQLLHVPNVKSDSSTLPSDHTIKSTMNHNINQNQQKLHTKDNFPMSNIVDIDQNNNSSSSSSSSSPTSSDDDNNLSKKLQKLLKLKTIINTPRLR